MARSPPVHADLHAHSTASDGLDSPEELVRCAARAGLSVLALTDHDTTSGLARAAAAAPPSLQIACGVEISCEDRGRERHVLGLFVDPEAPVLMALLDAARQERLRAGERLARRLASLGMPVSLEEARRHARGESLGRPHFARALVEKGYVASVAEAFDRWLGTGRPACVFKARPSVGEAIGAIHAAGGLAALAHPGVYRPAPAGREELSRLRQMGLDALEVCHPGHDETLERRYRAFARGLGLLPTGGSDWHGPGRGPSPGSHGLGRAEYEALVAHLRQRRK